MPWDPSKTVKIQFKIILGNKKNKSTFESENLVVDWIGLNIQGLCDRKQVKQIAKYLFQNFGFNSTLALGSDGKEEILFKDSKNKYQVFLESISILTYTGTELK